MSLNSATVKITYSGDGSTASFPVPFVFWDDDDLKLIHTDSSGTETDWIRGSQYTVSGGSGATGSIGVNTSPTDFTPASGETLTIKSNLSNIQELVLPAGGAFPPASVEQQFDKLARQVQQLSEQIARAALLREGSSSSGLTLPDPSAGASLRFNTAGDDLEAATATDGGDITLPLPVADGGTGAATAATARDNLGINDAASANALSLYHHGGI